VFNWLLDLVYPPRCAACAEMLRTRERIDHFCQTCETTLLPMEAVCGRCGEPWTGAGPAPAECGRCLVHPPSVDHAFWSWEHGAAVRTAIAQLKYGGRTELVDPLTSGFQSQAAECPADRWDLIVPVPLHPRRRRKRGFNQSALLARSVGRKVGLTVSCRVLKRVRETDSQVGLTSAQRRDNMRGAFAVRSTRPIEGRRILLVDDVVTTGATTQACARTLKQAGARSVDVWSVARGA
jgi:ComF family protein